MVDSGLLALTLSSLRGIGRVRLRGMLEWLAAKGTEVTSPANAVSACREGMRLPELSDSDFEEATNRAFAIHEKCQSLGVTVHPFAQPSYPSQLRRLDDPPAILYSIGRFESEQRPRVAVIGTRKPTQWGLTTVAAVSGRIAE